MMIRGLIGGVAVLVAGAVFLAVATGGHASPDATPPNTDATPEAQPKNEENPKVETKTAVFAAGCFWGVELRFSKVEGVLDTEVGFMGGSTDHPSYKDVCTDKTGHAEVCKVTFDPKLVSYGELLNVFWHVHDPTQVNRQGPDFGTQYRTAIFYMDDEQKAEAEKSKAALQSSPEFKKRFGDKKIATQIVKAGPFWAAEDYHQDYLIKHGESTCHVGW